MPVTIDGSTGIVVQSGGQLTGYITGPIGANTANSGVFTSVTTTSAGQITGYITGAIGANTANSGVFTSVTTTSAGQITGYITGAIGANTANTGAFTSVTTTGNSTANNYTATNTITDSAGNVRDIVNSGKSSAYVLVAGDNGKMINITTGGVTVNISIFSAGNNITIYNNSASSQTITQGTSVTMYLAGTATTGNRTLAQRGLCTVVCVAANTFVISGAGLT